MHSEASSFTAHLLRGQRQAPEPKQSKRWGGKGLGVVLKIARPCVSTSHSPTVRGHRGWGEFEPRPCADFGNGAGIIWFFVWYNRHPFLFRVYKPHPGQYSLLGAIFNIRIRVCDSLDKGHRQALVTINVQIDGIKGRVTPREEPGD